MSPRVSISEIDLSTRVPGFSGVYGAIVIPAKKGPVDAPVLVTSESDFLRLFTPEGTVESGYSLAYFSALAFLEKSQSLWVRRAFAEDATHGGAVIRTGAGNSNLAWSLGLSLPSAYEYQANDLMVIHAKDPGEWGSKVGVKVLVPRTKTTHSVSSLFSTASHTILKSALTGGTTFADSGSALETGDPVIIKETTGNAFTVLFADIIVASDLFTYRAQSVTTGVALKMEFDGTADNFISGNIYYAINASSTTFKLAASSADAAAGNAIDLSGSAMQNVRFTPVCVVPPELQTGKTYFFIKGSGVSSLARTYSEAVAGVAINFSAFGSSAIFQRLNSIQGLSYVTGESLLFDGALLPTGLESGKTYYVSVINGRVFIAPTYSDSLNRRNLLVLSVFTQRVTSSAVSTSSSTVALSKSIPTGALVTISGNFPRPLSAASYGILKVQEGYYRLAPTVSDALLGSYVNFQPGFSEVVAAGSWDATTEEITVTKNYPTGTPLTLVGTPGLPLKAETYYAINVDATTIKLAASAADAVAGTAIGFDAPTASVTIVEEFDFTVTGSGSLTISSPVVIRETGAFVLQVVLSKNKNEIVETFTVSLDPSSKDGQNRSLYVSDVLLQSNYIRASVNPSSDITDLPVPSLDPIMLSGGSDGSPITDGRMISAASDFQNENARQVTVLMDGGWATPAFQTKLVSIAEARGDCVAILSTPYGVESSSNYLNDIVDYRSNVLNANSSYAALYTPHVKIYDKFNDVSIYVAPDGYAAAAISATAMNYEMWYPVGGFKRGVLNVNDVRRRFTQGEMDYLYDNGINPIRFYPGKGINIWGQKTLQSAPTARDRLNVRLLLIAIRPGIKEALDGFLFELNDEATRMTVKGLLDSYLEGVKARRGVTDYSVKCDSDNNLATDEDNYRMVVWIFIKPNKSVEEVKVPLAITSSGISFETAAQSL